MAISTSLTTTQLTSVPLSAHYTPSRPIEIPKRGKLVRPPIPSPLKCPPSPDLIFPMSPESPSRESPLTYQHLTPNTLHNSHDELPTQWYSIRSDSRSSYEPFMYQFPTLPQNNTAVGRDKNLSPTTMLPPSNGSPNVYGRTQSQKYPATTFSHAVSSRLSSGKKSQHPTVVNRRLKHTSTSSAQSHVHPLIPYRAGYISPPALSIISNDDRDAEQYSCMDIESSVYRFDRFLLGGVEDEKYCLAG